MVHDPAQAGSLCVHAIDVPSYDVFDDRAINTTSMMKAAASTLVLVASHTPPCQFMTALYQSMVHGKNRNPKRSQYHSFKTPVNHSEKTYKNMMSVRGINSPKIINAI